MLEQFYGLCLQRLRTPGEILSNVNTQELRAILDYANRFHHDTNATYATELINEAEFTDFKRRTISFMQR